MLFHQFSKMVSSYIRTQKNAHKLERILAAAPVTVGTPAEKMYTAVMLQRDPQNVAYFPEPEEITSIKRMDTSSPTGGRHAPNIFFRDNVSIPVPTVPRGTVNVNTQDMRSSAEYARLPRLVDANGMDAAQRTAWRQALERARQLDARGTPPAFIQQETGWYRGMDGKWRFNEQQGVEGDENAQYSIHATRDLSIKNQMKEYRAGQLTGHDEFYYGETPEILDAAGLARRPLVMSQTDFRKSRSEKHNVPPRAMTRLAEALEDPVLSFEMGDRIGILTKDIDGDGKPLLIAVQNDVELDGERVNRIKSAYGLDNPQAWIANQIAAGKKLRIYDNEKADSFLNGFGYLAERTEDYRLGDTIPEIRGNVNTENGGFVPLELPRLVDANGMDAAQRAACRQTLEQMPREKQMQFEMAADIARRFGAMVQARTMADGVQGSYQDGVISIDPTAVDPVRQVLIHELTHHMESSGLYSRFSDAALQFVAEDMGADVDTLRRVVMADYARAGVTLDEDGATREIVAKFAEEKLFADEETVRRLLARDRNLFQRVYDWIRDTVAKLQGTREQRRLIDAQNLYEKALRQAADGAQSAVGTQGAAAYSFASQTVPTWEKLGQKPDIEIVDIRNNGRKLPYAAERHDILNSEEVRSLYSQPPVNRDTGELIFVTPATLSHSFSNSGEDSIYAVRHLRKILENAVLTHAEPSRKANDNSTGVYTLFGAVRTETGIQPVKLKVKEYRNVGQDIPEAVRAYFERNGTQEEYSRAYDSRVLSLESIEKEEPSSSAFTSTPNGAVEYPSSSSTIRVHDLLRLVNSRYRKYVPTFSEMEKELSTAAGKQAESDIQGSSLPNGIPTSGGNVNTNHAAARKAAQLATIERSNPFDLELGAHTWIRGTEDILTVQGGHRQLRRRG